MGLLITITLATLVGVIFFGGICAILARRPLAGNVFDPAAVPAPEGNTVALGRSLFTEYLFPFEVASLLLLAALVGAIVLAKKEPPRGAASAGEPPTS